MTFSPRRLLAWLLPMMKDEGNSCSDNFLLLATTKTKALVPVFLTYFLLKTKKQTKKTKHTHRGRINWNLDNELKLRDV